MEAQTPGIVFLLDRDAEGSAPLREALARRGPLVHFHTLESLLLALEGDPPAATLVDVETLMDAPTGLVSRIAELRGRAPMGLVTGLKLEDFLPLLRVWGLLQVFVKSPAIVDAELEMFIDSVQSPISGFGLIRYLGRNIEMYNLSIRTLEEKRVAMERVINHFATNGYEIHDLYDVRLILEETINNALFHAFHRASGEEKYAVRGFTGLEDNESVRIEYGSDERTVGFAVTDNSGSLRVRTILTKLERQYNREGIFDESGRGLYLSRMLASQMILNIESGRRTQAVCLFDERRKSDRAKPLMVNYAGPDDFDEWRTDPEIE